MKIHCGSKAALCLFSVCLLLGATARAQDSEQRVKIKDVPEAVRKTAREQSRGARTLGFTKEVENGNTFYEVELRINGHNKDVLIDAAGAVVEIEEEVALSSLPAAVKAEIKKQAGKGKIISVESITKDNAVTAYEAHLSKGGKKLEIKLAPDGALISGEN
jgi:uncharacterized membrane protein YkoI